MTLDQTMGCDRVCVHHQLNYRKFSGPLCPECTSSQSIDGLWARDRNLRRTANEPDCGATSTLGMVCLIILAAGPSVWPRRGNAALILSLQILRIWRDRQIHGACLSKPGRPHERGGVRRGCASFLAIDGIGHR